MKIISIACKDFIQSTRSLVAVGMMIVVPLLITGLVGLAFGGVSGKGQQQMADFTVVVANLDRDTGSSPSLGSQIETFLESDQVPAWLKVSNAMDEAAARQAVLGQQAGAAVIIPAGFSQDFYGGTQTASLVIFADPAASAGPQVLTSLLDQYLAALYRATAIGRFAGQGSDPQVLSEYAQYSSAVSTELQSGSNALISLDNVGAEESSAGTSGPELVARIMAGMLIFFVFFSGANGAISILREEEYRTLPRLFTSPTRRSQVLAGKFLAIWLTILAQCLVLVIASRLLFGIAWGNPFSLAVVILGLSLASTGLGVFVLTFASNTRQAGVLTGGVLSVMGMLGGLFTSAVQNLPSAFHTVTLFTPQGWALRGLSLVLDGAAPSQTLPAALVTCAMGIVLFGLGVLRFQKRISPAY